MQQHITYITIVIVGFDVYVIQKMATYIILKSNFYYFQILI